MSGRRSLAVPFVELITALRSHYSFSSLKRVDWARLADKYRAPAEAASTTAAFADAIEPMLAELRDLHVWIELPDGQRRYPHTSRYRPNFDLQHVKSKLRDVENVTGIGFTGRTSDGFGVVVVTGLPTKGAYDEFSESMKRMGDAPGFIVDLRANPGGSEAGAAMIAGWFTDRRTKYARNQVRVGVDPNELQETQSRYFDPAGPSAYLRPVICLIGPGCVSSGEGFALMMKSLDHVRMIGQPTRGASGNPQPETLSNGVRVWFSRWVSLELDGSVIEGRGVLPDVVVEHDDAHGDSTFESALTLLRKK